MEDKINKCETNAIIYDTNESRRMVEPLRKQ